MRKVVIYGIGEVGKQYVDNCISQGLSNFHLVDSNSALWKSNIREWK